MNKRERMIKAYGGGKNSITVKHNFEARFGRLFGVASVWIMFGLLGMLLAFGAGCNGTISPDGGANWRISPVDELGQATTIGIPPIFGRPDRDTSESEGYSSPNVIRPTGF